MNLTNKFNLPEPIFNAIKNDPYNSGDCDISTTRLISPPQIVALSKRYHDQLEEDVSDRIWSLLGQAIHVILERAGKGKVTEKRLFADIEGCKLSGAIDLANEQTLVDYKVTSVWAYVYKYRMDEWAAQGNVNRWLCHTNGIEISNLQNILILRDWSMGEKGRLNGKASLYPNVQIVTVDLPMWSLDETERYIRERIRLHKEAEGAKDDEITPCTDEERWLNKGKNTRCLSYCPVMPFCHQAKKLGLEKPNQSKAA